MIHQHLVGHYKEVLLVFKSLLNYQQLQHLNQLVQWVIMEGCGWVVFQKLHKQYIILIY